jgi:hypothetical protein
MREQPKNKPLNNETIIPCPASKKTCIWENFLHVFNEKRFLAQYFETISRVPFKSQHNRYNMKKTFFLAGIVTLLFNLAANAQQPTQPAPEPKKTGNPTVDSIESKYTLSPMPNPMTTEQIFPVIGQYQSSTNADQKVTITLDDQNKGFVWIDGLPQGRVKGVLKKSPGTYKIPAQKTAEGTQVQEGTLIFDKDANTLNIVLGRPFNDADPASVLATTTTTTDESSMTDNAKVTKTKGNKTKTKVKKPEPWVFTGTKILTGTAVNQ